MILGVVSIILILIPGMVESISSYITGDETLCANTPYDPNCYCTIDRVKIWSRFRYACLSQSPKATTECDWCNKQCVEWRAIWDRYPSPEKYNAYCTDRMPVPEYACVARVSEFGTIECAAVPSIHTEGLTFFCSGSALSEFITEWQGTDAGLVDFFRNSCPIPGKNPYDNCDLNFEGGSGTGTTNGEKVSSSECISECYDINGILVGGHVLWEAVWKTETREIIISQAGWYGTDCISGV